MTEGVLFNFIPGAGLVAPGQFFEVNSGGQFESVSRMLLLGHCASAGTLAAATPTICNTIEEAAGFCGVGSQLYEMFRVARANAPAQEIWLGRVAITGDAPTWTIAVGSLASAAADCAIEIAGRRIVISKAASETAATTAAALNAAINAYVDPLTKAYLPVTSTVSTNTVTITARHAGTTMNEIETTVDVGFPLNGFTSSNVTIGSGTTGTGTASISAVLAALNDDAFDWIVSPFNDATNVGLAETALSDTSGRWAWNIQIYGHYFSPFTGTTSEATTYGLARNSRHTTAVYRVACPTPSWEWVAGIIGRIAPWLGDNVNGNASRNQSNLEVEGIRPPRARTAWPNAYAVVNSLLNNGMSTFKVNSAGKVVVDKIITHQRVNAQGQPDSVFRDVQAIAQVMHGLRYMRAGLSYKHSNKAIASANPGNLPAISTPDDIKADCIALYGELVDRGLFEDKAGFASRLRVARDSGNPNRVNIGMNLDRVNPLDILAANATVYSQFPKAA